MLTNNADDSAKHSKTSPATLLQTADHTCFNSHFKHALRRFLFLFICFLQRKPPFNAGRAPKALSKSEIWFFRNYSQSFVEILIVAT